MEKPRTARLLHKLLVLYQRIALYLRNVAYIIFTVSGLKSPVDEAICTDRLGAVFLRFNGVPSTWC